MRTLRSTIAVILMVVAARASAGSPAQVNDAVASAFSVKPYLQLGHIAAADKLVLLWHTQNVDAEWSVEYQAGSDGAWTKSGELSFRTVELPGVERTAFTAPC